MTREEAERILWPEQAIEQTRFRDKPALSEVEGLREKFLAGDPFFSERLEDKTLVLEGDERLKGEHNRRIGKSRSHVGAVLSSSQGQASRG